MEIPGQHGRGNFQGDRKYSGEALSSRISCVYSLLLSLASENKVVPGNTWRRV